MYITSITRNYSKTINAKNYGAPEAWLKIEATYTATVESQDDPAKVSAALHDQCQKDVVEQCNALIKKIKGEDKMVVPQGSAIPVPGNGNIITSQTQPRSI